MSKTDCKDIAVIVIGGIAIAFSVKYLKQWGVL